MSFVIPHFTAYELKYLHNRRDNQRLCERYGANDDVVGQWLAAAVRLLLINDNSRLKAIYKSAKVGSDSEPSRGRLQPNRRAERDFCGKGGVA